MALDFDVLYRAVNPPQRAAANDGPVMVWILTDAPVYGWAHVDKRHEPASGWCEITETQAARYRKALADGLSVPRALRAAELPPSRPGCPPLPPLDDIVLGAITVPTPPPSTERDIPRDGSRRAVPTTASPYPPRAPRPPRRPRAARPPRKPRAPRPPRAKRPPRPPRPPRQPRAPRAPRPRRPGPAAQARFLCIFKPREDGTLQFGHSDHDTPENRAKYSKAGLVYTETYSPASCVEQACTGKLSGILRALLGLLPKTWHPTVADAERVAAEQLTRRQANRKARRQQAVALANSTAPDDTGLPPQVQGILVYVVRTDELYARWGKARLGARQGVDPSTVYGGNRGAEFVNVGITPTIRYDIFIE